MVYESRRRAQGAGCVTCLRSIPRLSWTDRVSDTEVRDTAPNKGGKLVDQYVDLHRLRWLRYILHVCNHYLFRQPIFVIVSN